MSAQIIIVCTDKGQHGRLELARLRRTSAGVEHVRTRNAPTPGGPTATLRAPGEAPSLLGATIPVAAPDVRDDFEGRQKFRFQCPVCLRDDKWGEATATHRVDALLAAGMSTVDISRIP